MYYVYRHIRLDTNEVFYVGRGKEKIRNGKVYKCDEYYRAFDKSNRNIFWNNIANKTEYRVDIIYECDNEFDVCKKEIEFIKLYGRRDLKQGTLVNLTNGGEKESGKIITEEHRKKLSESSKGRVKSVYTRKKLSESLKGRVFSEEHKRKLSISKTGFRHSEEAKLKMSIAKKGKKRSDSFRELQRKNQTGRVYSDESKKKMSESKKGRYNMYNHPSAKKVVDRKNGIIYNSLKLMCHENNLNYDTMRSRLCGRLKNNTTFMYLDEFNKL